MFKLDMPYYSIEMNENENYWSYTISDGIKIHKIKLPCFEINGSYINIKLKDINQTVETKKLRNGVCENIVSGNIVDMLGAKLHIIFRTSEESPIVRFKYMLISKENIMLTKKQGHDNLSYMAIIGNTISNYKEIKFSDFNEKVHSFSLSESLIEKKHFDNEIKIMGPMLIENDKDYTTLIAYEHGSQVPDCFIEFRLRKDYNISLNAVKGNYYNGQIINDSEPYETIWLEFAGIKGNEELLAKLYRTFVLKFMSTNIESRKPYIFYNTWGFQERNKWWNGNKYLDSMNEDRILKEIEIAHKMGIDVFVLDTGWYEKTGDWIVNRKRFSDNLRIIKNKLDEYNMKLGLWFDPQAAAVSSNMLKNNRECTIKQDKKEWGPWEVWETEESYRMCLVSKYSEDFAKELIRLVKEVGVKYFKWDAIFQYGCDDASHYHGGKQNSSEERADCYAFQIGIFMTKVVDKLCNECPEAIVDFDITEGQRYVGLGFLSAGKYFLMNNGPYYGNYDIQFSEPCTEWSNIFVHPGNARGWICRTPLSFDKWIPSILFLTHYLPDDPKDSQMVNIASLILGQNGIWGDLLSVSEEGVQLFNKLLTYYKMVRDDITLSYPARSGNVGGSPEIYEKINDLNGKGAVVIFANNKGKYTYITSNKVCENLWFNDGVKVEFDECKRAKIETTFEKAGVKIIFFGDKNCL